MVYWQNPGTPPLLFTFKNKLSGVPVKYRIIFQVFFWGYTIKNNEMKKQSSDFFSFVFLKNTILNQLINFITIPHLFLSAYYSASCKIL